MRLPVVRFTVQLTIALSALTSPNRAAAQAPVDSPSRQREPRRTGEIERKAEHYRDLASMQAQLEAEHRAEERHWLSRVAEGAPREEMEGLAEEEAEEATRHARLRGQYERLATRPWEPAPLGLPLPYPWDRDRDRDVLVAALRHLMDPEVRDDGELNAPNLPPVAAVPPGNGWPGEAVVLDEKTDRWPEDWKLDEGDRGKGWDEEAVSDWRRRNAGGPFLLGRLGFKTKKIVVANVTKLFDESVEQGVWFSDYVQRKHRGAGLTVIATLPGYSRDGNTAVLFLKSVTGNHNSFFKYLMAKSKEGWKVKRRSIHFNE